MNGFEGQAATTRSDLVASPRAGLAVMQVTPEGHALEERRFKPGNRGATNARSLESLAGELLAMIAPSSWSGRAPVPSATALEAAAPAGLHVLMQLSTGLQLHLGRIDQAARGKRIKVVEVRWTSSDALSALPASMVHASVDWDVLRVDLPAGLPIEDEVLLESISIVTTGPSNRRWLRCPGVQDGKTCGKLALKLYSEFATPGFRCRDCSARHIRTPHIRRHLHNTFKHSQIT